VVLPAGTLSDATLRLEGDPKSMQVDLVAAQLRSDPVLLQNATGRLHIVDQKGAGTLRAANATMRKVAARDLSADLDITGRTVSLANLHGKAYDGDLVGRAAIDFQNPAAPRYDLEFTAQQLDADRFLSGMTPLRGVVTGKVNLQSGWKYTGSEPKQILSTLTGNGQAMALSGRLQELPVMTSIANLLQLPSLKSMPYKDLGMHFAVQSGRLAVQDLKLRTDDADAGVGGSIGLDGSLDLSVHLLLSKALSQHYLSGNRTAAALGSLFADPTGRLAFDFAVGGDYKSPKLRADLQKSAQTAGLTALTTSVLERLLGGKLPLPLPLPGSSSASPQPPTPSGTPAAGAPATSTKAPTPPPDADAARRAAEEAARKAAEDAQRRLGGKLGGVFKRPAAAPRDSTVRPDSIPHR
jgi:hypothetical protein